MTIRMFGANIAWVSYNSVLLLPLVQKVVSPDYSSRVVGSIAFAANIIGILISFVPGILRDHTTSQLGRRTPGIQPANPEHAALDILKLLLII